jgi:hypothetical protein
MTLAESIHSVIDGGYRDQVPGIVMSISMMGVGIFLLYRAWRGRGIDFR